MMRAAYFVPLGVFAFVLGLSGFILSQPKNDDVPSQMIAKPLPEFTLPPAIEGEETVSSSDFTQGQPKLLNFWASWCIPCVAEAPHLESLKKAGVSIIGISVKDTPQDVEAFLNTHGNPYEAIGKDEFSTLQFELGSSGLPETYVIDGKGVIRYQHIGDIRKEHVPMLLEKLEEVK